MFVSRAHGVWNPETNRHKKPSKRYGNLIQSPKEGLSEILMHHKSEVYEWISERVDVHDSDETEEERPTSRSPKKEQARNQLGS